MDGYGILAGLLGGYAQGRQLRQNRDIRQAQIKRQVVQDAYTRAHQAKMEDYAARRLKLAENPIRNLDPAAQIAWKNSKDDLDKYWTDWRNRMKEGGTLAERTRILQEGLDALPGHRRQLQSNIDKWGTDVGYAGADPDMFLGPMHGIQGLKYDPATQQYIYENKDNANFDSQFGITKISPEDKASIEKAKELVANSNLTPEQRRSYLQNSKDYIKGKYGARAADIEFPHLPGDAIPIGISNQFVPTTPGYVPFVPSKEFTLPGDINPAVGIKSPTERIRRVLDPQQMREAWGADAPGSFAPQEEKNAYVQGRYELAHVPGHMGLPGFQVPMYRDRDKEFRRNYMARVLNPNPNETDGEVVGMGVLVDAFKQRNPNFNPFLNADDARELLQVVPPTEAPTFHRVIARIAETGGFERQVGETKPVNVMGEYDILPKASTELADANKGLAETRTGDIKAKQPLQIAEIKARIKNYNDVQDERLWRRGFDLAKENDTSKRGWTQLGINNRGMNLRADQQAFQQRMTTHKSTLEDYKFVQGMYKHSDATLKTLQTQLTALSTRFTGLQAQYNANAGVLADAGLENWQIENIRKGLIKPGTPYYDKLIKGPDMINAANMLHLMAVTEKKMEDIHTEIEIAKDDQAKAARWEEGVRANFDPKERQKATLYALLKKTNPEMSDDDLEAFAEMGQLTPEAEAYQKKQKAGKGKTPAAAKPGKPVIGSDFNFTRK